MLKRSILLFHSVKINKILNNKPTKVRKTKPTGTNVCGPSA